MLPKVRQKLCITYDIFAHAYTFQVKLSFTMKLIKIMRISIFLGQPRNKVKGNRSVRRSGKVNPAFLYRNRLGAEKQTITQELYGQRLPGNQVWIRIKTSTIRTAIRNAQVCQVKKIKESISAQHNFMMSKCIKKSSASIYESYSAVAYLILNLCLFICFFKICYAYASIPFSTCHKPNCFPMYIYVIQSIAQISICQLVHLFIITPSLFNQCVNKINSASDNMFLNR